MVQPAPFLTVLLTLLPLTAPARSLFTRVDAGDGRTCGVQLRIPEGASQLPMVATLNGSGLYSMADEASLNPAVLYVFRKAKASVLTIDKPGIVFEGGKFAVDDSVFNQHEQQDLVNCLENALAWAQSQEEAGFNGRLALMGHSEGAMVIVRLLERQQLTKGPLPEKASVILLSGLPLEPFEKIMKGQLSAAKLASLRKAMAAKDGKAVRAIVPVGSAYMRSEFEARPVRKILEQLAKSALDVSVQVFHGLLDRNVSADAVRDFEGWNDERRRDGKPALHLNARYYEAGHSLNLAATNDMVMLLEAYLSP